MALAAPDGSVTVEKDAFSVTNIEKALGILRQTNAAVKDTLQTLGANKAADNEASGNCNPKRPGL